MKINDIKNVFDAKSVLESNSPQSEDILLESASEMIRKLRSVIADQYSPTDEFGQEWTSDYIAAFIAALEKIEKVVEVQLSNNTIKPDLRNTVFSILNTVDFDHATNIQKIVKQSHDQQERIDHWKQMIDSGDHQLPRELDIVGRNISSLVGLLRTKGAQQQSASQTQHAVEKPAENPAL